jgi:uncharacterized membrane protein
VSALVHVAAGVAAAANGVGAGIMLSTVLGIAPMFLALPYPRYVQTVQFLWPRYDPLMPVLNGATLVLDIVLCLTAPATARPAYVVAAALLATVMAISITRNVPVNKYVFRLDPDRQPTNWPAADPRRRWRNWNFIRTMLALAAFATNVVAALNLS